MVDYKCFNLHNAKLPDYRGHNSLTYEILNNEKEHQITIHWMVAEVDRGFTALTKSIQISNFDTAYSVYNKCLEEAPKLFLKFMEMLENNDLPKTPIVGEAHYYSLVLNKEVSDGLSVEDMEKYSRAFFFPECEPAYLLSGEKKLYLLPEVFWKK